MKICAISDMHGKLDFSIPKCDLLLIAGDICPDFAPGLPWGSTKQLEWIHTKFLDWLEAQPVGGCLATWGNHDFTSRFSPLGESLRPHIVMDEQVEFNGLKIWFSPWSNLFGGWAWMQHPEVLDEAYSVIPTDTDIIVSHQPPHGVCDKIPEEMMVGRETSPHVGSEELYAHAERVRPMMIICGHIHNGRGQGEIVCDDGYTILVNNVSMVNEQYKRVYEPVEFEL